MSEFLNGLYQADYWFGRVMIQRGLGIIYLIAFINALNQFTPLLGEKGLLPLPRFLDQLSFRDEPSIFHWYYSDGFFNGLSRTGVALSAITITGLSEQGPFWISMLVWFLLWVLYLSIVNVGIVFYGFGWESMVLEAGFYAIFLGPLYWAAPVLVILIFRWMLFRVEFGAGLIKMRGDPCWRDLTCMNYHHETQPLPNPLSWFFHRIPGPLHKAETFFNHLVQLIVVWGLFFPQPIASISAALIILSQVYLIITGNYSWLNWLTVILAFSGFSDGVLNRLFGLVPPVVSTLPLYFEGITALLAVVVIWLSIDPIRNMVSRRQRMNFSFNALHLVNTYGAFGSVTKKRFEIVIEGTGDETISDNTEWKAYEFKGKPGDPGQRPPQIAPYHLRLDWQMWFAAMSPSYQRHSWFLSLITKLLSNEKPVLKLLKYNPFPDHPPVYIRARLFHYGYTCYRERKETGRWWNRTFVREYMSPRSLKNTTG